MIQIPNGLVDSVFHGNCKDLLTRLPDNSVDLVVSSPPYNLGKEYEKRTALEHYVEEQTRILTECHRVLKPTGSIFWQVGSYAENGALIPLDIKFFPVLESLGMIPRNRIVWVRQHGLHATRKFSARHETILWFTKTNNHKFFLDAIRVPQKWQNKKSYRGPDKGKLTCNPLGKNPGDIWLFRNVKHNHEEQTIHPCQFPEDMIARIVLAVTEKGDMVLDPYMGVGTVAVVAKNTGRHFLGAELDDKYYQVALRRLSGLPDDNNAFPNLKTLRDYVERTGEAIAQFHFDVQVGQNPSERSRAKVYSEEHHSVELYRRLEFEENSFAARLGRTEMPDDTHFVHRPRGRSQQLLELFPTNEADD